MDDASDGASTPTTPFPAGAVVWMETARAFGWVRWSTDTLVCVTYANGRNPQRTLVLTLQHWHTLMVLENTPYRGPKGAAYETFRAIAELGDRGPLRYAGIVEQHKDDQTFIGTLARLHRPTWIIRLVRDPELAEEILAIHLKRDEPDDETTALLSEKLPVDKVLQHPLRKLGDVTRIALLNRLTDDEACAVTRQIMLDGIGVSEGYINAFIAKMGVDTARTIVADTVGHAAQKEWHQAIEARS